MPTQFAKVFFNSGVLGEEMILPSISNSKESVMQPEVMTSEEARRVARETCMVGSF